MVGTSIINILLPELSKMLFENTCIFDDGINEVNTANNVAEKFSVKSISELDKMGAALKSYYSHSETKSFEYWNNFFKKYNTCEICLLMLILAILQVK